MRVRRTTTLTLRQRSCGPVRCRGSRAVVDPGDVVAHRDCSAWQPRRSPGPGGLWTGAVGVLTAATAARRVRSAPRPARLVGAPSAPASPAASASGRSRHPAAATACDYTATGRRPSRSTRRRPPGCRPAARSAYVLKMTNGDVTHHHGPQQGAVHGQLVRVAGRAGLLRRHPCHRLADSGIFVLQCGDPTGTGTGGPGYTFADETDGTRPTAGRGGDGQRRARTPTARSSSWSGTTRPSWPRRTTRSSASMDDGRRAMWSPAIASRGRRTAAARRRRQAQRPGRDRHGDGRRAAGRAADQRAGDISRASSTGNSR